VCRPSASGGPRPAAGLRGPCCAAAAARPRRGAGPNQALNAPAAPPRPAPPNAECSPRPRFHGQRRCAGVAALAGYDVVITTTATAASNRDMIM
jgi:hypothetical protein